MKIALCKHPGCRGWANRSGMCPQHDGKYGPQFAHGARFQPLPMSRSQVAEARPREAGTGRFVARVRRTG